MRFKLQSFDILEYGQRKDSQGNPHQEDSLFPQKGHATEDDRLFIVCDGMGGHDAGEVASQTVCESMSKFILHGDSGSEREGDFSDKTLVEAVEEAFCALNLKDTGALRKMGTTMTFLKLHNKGCTIAHIGDSRVYQIRPGKTREDTKVVFVTEDHSLVNELVKCGEITKEEARNHPRKNVITRAMQPNMERYPRVDVYHSCDIRAGDYFYLCTDGMLENMDDQQLCFYFSEAAGDDPSKVKKLIDATKSNKDNHTAILVHILDVIDPLDEDAVERKTVSLAVNPSSHCMVTADLDDVDNEQEQSSEEEEQPVQPEMAAEPASDIKSDPKEAPSSEPSVSASAPVSKDPEVESQQIEETTENDEAEESEHAPALASATADVQPLTDDKASEEQPAVVSAGPSANSHSAHALQEDAQANMSTKGAIGKNGKRGFLSIVLGVVAVVVICYFLMQTCSDGNDPKQAAATKTEQTNTVSKVNDKDNADSNHRGTWKGNNSYK